MAEGVLLTDCTGLGRVSLAKVLVRADPGGALDAALGVPPGRAVRDGEGVLVVRTAPDAWLLLAPAGAAAAVVRRVEARGADEFASVVDVTHAHALVRLTGAGAADVLATVCAIDLSGAAAPDGTAFRSHLAGVTATVVRDDEPAARPHNERAAPSFLVLCDRSYGEYLADVLTDAGEEPGVR